MLSIVYCLYSINHQSLGAGEKENTFWRNYFFHCAYTRYENGLSIEEIWSTKPKAIITGGDVGEQSQMARTSEPSLHDIAVDDESSVEMDFDDDNNNEKQHFIHSLAHSISAANSESDVDEVQVQVHGGNTVSDHSSPSTAVNTKSDSDGSGSGTSYEMIHNDTGASASADGGGDDIGDDMGDDDVNIDDLDDLEAEIARELGED